MIYITGDLHGNIDITKLNSKNFKEGLSLTKNDYLIILGDFGLIWSNSKEELRWRKWLHKKPWTTLFIDGNHENFILLNEFPIEIKFGGKVHKINDSIYHLMRGEIYTLENKNFFTFGGAKSIDKYLRTEGKSWWKEEIPTKEEMDYGIENLYSSNYNIDYVLTHNCPSDIFPYVVQNSKKTTQLESYLNNVKYLLDEKSINYKWYFGHYHQDINIGNNFRCLYYDIIKIKTESYK